MEPISSIAGTLGLSFLTEGIKFFWNQAGEIIKKFRDKKESPSKEHDIIKQLEKAETEVPEFIPMSSERIINFERVEQKIDDLKTLRKELAPYVVGDEEISINNLNMLQCSDKLQKIIYYIFNENISYPEIKVKQVLEKVSETGSVTGVEVENFNHGNLSVDQDIKEVNSGKVIGGKINTIG